jgi:hypothetical protein
MGCENNSCGWCKDGKKCVCCGLQRILKVILQVFKITALLGLTLVLFDIHSGLKAQFEGMQMQQAMMMNAAANGGGAPAVNSPSK